ncbi:hypothetical protein EJ04DRAFT_515532 [Polyplosphaeria fusca]|uniref:Uncharacterized protein n=1 Tax=Polyplosphaeria fusca TaxID=682080 RepID=A0A9P4QP12_9PLEO|nr:hypothetical protein EJ04DRAFT_515532 [Polyplosphaeria fusca]
MDSFKPPPTAECILNDDCLSFGKKTPTPGQICAECLRFYEIPQLQKWAAADNGALALIDAELSRRQQAKANIETSGKFLCAFEDPDFRNSPWRADEFNLRILRGRKADCGRVSRKGKACDPCWKQYLQKVAVVKYFDPTGMCHEQVDKMAAESSKSKAVENQSADADDDDDWGDVEGYDTI